jgi:DNA-binding NarL/FixJ family response regulator
MRLSILIVDDHEPVRRSLREWLHVSFPDCDVVCTANAEEALAAAAKAPPGLVIMDVRLPGMDGLEATRELRARQFRMPIVILTHHDDVPTRARATAVGASALVSKHIMHAELPDVLEAFLPESAKHSETSPGEASPQGRAGRRRAGPGTTAPSTRLPREK